MAVEASKPHRGFPTHLVQFDVMVKELAVTAAVETVLGIGPGDRNGQVLLGPHVPHLLRVSSATSYNRLRLAVVAWCRI
jgi:hypothetical protein